MESAGRTALLWFLMALALAGAPPSSVPSFVVGRIRVQALSPTLVRLEVAGPQGFEDRPTFHVVERDWPGTEVRRLDSDLGVVLRAEHWMVRVPRNARDLREVTLTDARGAILHAGEGRLTSSRNLPDPGDRPEVWSVADTPRLVPPPWGATPAPPGAPRADTSGWDLGNDAPDLYVFLPRGDYHQLRRDLLRLTGPTELPPLYLFGNFHSRYFPYTDKGALGVIREYRERGFPLDVFVLDTDWRVSASFGYEENLKLFPDLQGFLAKARDLGVKVGLNDHPKPLADTALDPRELEYRCTNLARWLKVGVAFWWFDRNWEVSLAEPLPGLCKEVWGMRLYRDLTQRAVPERRPLIMANVDGIDNGHLNRPSDLAAHRFPFQWTGDTWMGWDYLRWGVENAVQAGVRSLLPYLSEDIGTHQGIPSPEFYLRFYQYGVLSPVLRPHCSNSFFFRREPWTLGPEVEAIARDYLRMRYRLLPVLYAAARQNYDTGEPLLRRLDLSQPSHPEAAYNDQYLLGDDLLVAPIMEGEPITRTVPGAWLRTAEGKPGLALEFFANENLLGEPVLRRVEAVVDAHWSDGPPGPGVPGEHFSTRWSGRLTPDRPVQVGLAIEEGGRLWLDGQLVADQWVHTTWNLGLDAVTLVPGRSYELRVESRHSDGDPFCHLFYRPMELPAGAVARTLWVPEGEWLDAWTGDRCQGPRTLEIKAGAAVIPLYIRAGSLLPLAPDMLNTRERPWNPVTLDLYPHPGRVARAELYEDDQESNAYQRGACRRSPLEATLEAGRKRVTLRIGEAAGTFPDAPGERAWVLRMHLTPDMKVIQQVRVDGRPVAAWRVLPRGRAPTPFQTAGPALDGDVLELPLPARPVTQARVVEVRYR